MKRKVGTHHPPCTSDCRTYCQVLELLKVGGGQGQGQTIGKTYPLSLRPHSLALYHHGGNMGLWERQNLGSWTTCWIIPAEYMFLSFFLSGSFSPG